MSTMISPVVPAANASIIGRSARIAVISTALMLGACAQGGGQFDLGLGLDEPKTTDIATASAGAPSQTELEKAIAYWGEKAQKNPRDGKATLNFARNLKAMGRKEQAYSVLQGGYMFNTSNREYLSEYGRLALSMGQVSMAEKLLARADDPAKPDWRILSARGTVAAKRAKFKEAISYLEQARRLAPGKASVMNNLAMAYTMDGQAARGEGILREAQRIGTRDPRVKQNLALVLDLQGKKDEARSIESGAMAPPARVQLASPANPGGMGLKPSRVEVVPLPVVAAVAKPGKLKVTPAVASSRSLDPDEIIRAAMAAEHAKTAKR